MEWNLLVIDRSNVNDGWMMSRTSWQQQQQQQQESAGNWRVCVVLTMSNSMVALCMAH